MRSAHILSCCCTLLLADRHVSAASQDAPYQSNVVPEAEFEQKLETWRAPASGGRDDGLDAPYTMRKQISGYHRRIAGNGGALAMDEMDLCDQQIGCAGVTFTLPPSSSDAAEMSSAAELLQAMVHNYLPPNLGDASVSNKDQVRMRIASWERRRQAASATADSDIDDDDDDDIQSEGSNKKEEKREKTKKSVLMTYQSKKAFVFHRGRVVADPHDEHRRTVSTIGLNEAKSRCQADENCVAFSFPIVTSASHMNLSAAENVTFISKVLSVDRDGGASDEWRSYISNVPGRYANKVNGDGIAIHKTELEQPYSTKHCCTRTEPMPTPQDIALADELPRVSCNISKEEFRQRYETPRLPVALVGCDKRWRSTKLWTKEKLLERFDNATTFVGKFHNRRMDKDNYETWGWVKEAMAKGEDYYIFDSLIAHPEAAKLKRDFTMPGPIENMYDHFEDFPPGYGPSRWWTSGQTGSGTWPHLDPIGADAWNYVSSGSKWWIIYPLGEELNYGNLYCDDDCSPELWNAPHWFANVGATASLNEYDGMNPNKRPLHVLQRPGEVLYLPNKVVHAVYNLEPTVAVAAHFASTQNLQVVWDTIVSLGSDKHWTKAYYGGILSKEQRQMVRTASGRNWPPEAGWMYFHDGPFLPAMKRKRNKVVKKKVVYDDDDYYDDDDDDELHNMYDDDDDGFFLEEDDDNVAASE